MAPPAIAAVDSYSREELLAEAAVGTPLDHTKAAPSLPAHLKVAGDLDVAAKRYVTNDAVPTLADLKRAIPAHCFKPSTLRSLSYVARDFVALAALYAGAYATHGTKWSPFYLPLFWFWAGLFFWALFVLAHDCGHGSFSRSKTVNSIVGHTLNSLILVPYHSWRITHRDHHKNTGNYERDEIFYPMPESEYAGIKGMAKWVYSNTFFLACFGYPIYLLRGYGNRKQNASHLSPGSELFVNDVERSQVTLSVACWWVMASALAFATFRYGAGIVAVYYGVPYLIYCTWLLVVTFLHHTEPGTMWYNSENWNYVKGNLQSVDRVYGWLENLHHDIGSSHTTHHLFSAIPHYHLREAAAAVKPLVGEMYNVSDKPVWTALWEAFAAWSQSHVIPDGTDVFAIPAPSRSKAE